MARAGGGVFAIAGLWEQWREPGGGWLRTCTLVTVPASESLARIHDRMPAILRPEGRDAWLDRRIDDPGRLLPLLEPYAGALDLRAVSRRVNRPEHDDPECLAPAPEGAPA